VLPCRHPSGLHPGHVAGVRVGDRHRGSARANERCCGRRRSYLSRARSGSTHDRHVQLGSIWCCGRRWRGPIAGNRQPLEFDYDSRPSGAELRGWFALRPGCCRGGRGYNAPRVRPRSSTARQLATGLGSEPVMQGLRAPGDDGPAGQVRAGRPGGRHPCWWPSGRGS
jgi:hypothetical protein